MAVAAYPSCKTSHEGEPSRQASSTFSFSGFADPPSTYHPWVRWWWPGGDVTDDDLSREVRLLAENQFGGAEIQAFDAALDPSVSEDEMLRRLSFGTGNFNGHLATVMEEALVQGLLIELNLGSGWPTGGMHVSAGDSLKTLLWSEHSFTGPGQEAVDLSDPDKPIFYLIAELAETLFGERMARYEGALARLVAVLAARVTGGVRTPCPLDLKDWVELDPDSVQVLTDRVDENGILTWNVPEGRWQVIGIYEAPDGEYPLLNAQPEPGYVLDHMNQEEVLRHLEHLFGPASGLEPYHGAPFQGFFNDSLELKAERLYARNLFQEFRERRGYDLVPWLPAVLVPGADNSTFDTAAIKRGPAFRFSQEDNRILYDYVHTISDLFIERFVENASRWAENRGMAFRAQSYGMNLDTIRAAGAAHIPEAEQLYAGGSEMFLKMVSSGGILYNRPVVSAEADVWIGRAYMTTPLKIKASADKMFTSGINRIVFHGFPYRKNHDYGETGWHPFASPYGGFSVVSSNLSEASPFWPYMPLLNRYIARCQYALLQGKPAVDLLVYYPWMGFQTTLAAVPDHGEFLLSGQFGDLEPEVGLDDLLQIGIALGLSEISPQVKWLAARWSLFQELERSGYTWAWVNDERLQEARFHRGEIKIQGRRFKGVVIVESPWMRPETAENVGWLAEQGAALLLAGETPNRQPGFLDYVRGDLFVAQAMEQVKQGSRVGVLDSQKGASDMLTGLGVAPAIRFVSGGESIRNIGREFPGGGRVFFVRNPAFEDITAGLDPDGECHDAWWVDAWNETADRIKPEGDGLYEVHLPPHGSGLFFCDTGDAGFLRDYGFSSSGKKTISEGGHQAVRQTHLDSWSLLVQGEDVPGGEVRLVFGESLPDWRDLDELRYSSSHGIYGTDVELLKQDLGEEMLLKVGWVHGAAEVRVNHQPAGSLLAPPFALGVGSYLVPGRNRIEIEVIPSLRNRLNGWALAGDERYRQFMGKEDMLVPAGIRGPVVLEPPN